MSALGVYLSKEKATERLSLHADRPHRTGERRVPRVARASPGPSLAAGDQHKAAGNSSRFVHRLVAPAAYHLLHPFPITPSTSVCSTEPQLPLSHRHQHLIFISAYPPLQGPHLQFPTPSLALSLPVRADIHGATPLPHTSSASEPTPYHPASIMAAPTSVAVSADTLITIKITVNEDATKKLKLPVRDLGINVLPVKVSLDFSLAWLECGCMVLYSPGTETDLYLLMIASPNPPHQPGKPCRSRALLRLCRHLRSPRRQQRSSIQDPHSCCQGEVEASPEDDGEPILLSRLAPGNQSPGRDRS